MSTSAPGTTPYYYVPQPSRHPALAALALFFVILGAGQWLNSVAWGEWSLYFGLALLAFVLFQWFGDAIRESESGQYGRKIDF